jgi:hypothetical protein
MTPHPTKAWGEELGSRFFEISTTNQQLRPMFVTSDRERIDSSMSFDYASFLSFGRLFDAILKKD